MTAKTQKKQLVWLIDDTAEHHATARATIAALPGWQLTGYLDAAEAVAAFTALATKKPRDLPAVVLMDFFLGGTYGNLVTAELRKLQPVGAPITIVGYSSVASASAAIVAAGGDVIVRKHRDERGMNPSLERFLETYPR
jgi:FixJ family two-component response regulator